MQHQPGLAPTVDGLAGSLSRTDDTAVCAVAESESIGIDVERLRPWEELADMASLIGHSMPGDARGLLALWTRKEALAKALRTGLPDDVREFEVPAEQLEPGYWQRRDGWLWIGCPCEDGCVASLVVELAGSDECGTCDVVEAELNEQDVRAWSIELRT